MLSRMAATIPTREPDSFTSGDTVKWSKPFPDYPASDGWTLKYYIRGAKTLDVTAEADGSGYLATINATDSAKLAAGDYPWSARVSKAGEVYTVGSGTFTVLPDLSVVTEGYDGRSICKQLLDQVEETLLGLSGKKYSAKTIDGVTYTLKNIQELRDFRDRLKDEYAAELRAARVASGRHGGRTRKMRFI
jgi:hypothetical protein